MDICAEANAHGENLGFFLVFAQELSFGTQKDSDCAVSARDGTLLRQARRLWRPRGYDV